MDKSVSAFDTREFQISNRKGSNRALRGLIGFLFALILLASALAGVLGGAYFYAANQDPSVTAPVALPSGNSGTRSGLSLGAATASVLPVCAASGSSYAVGSGIVITEDGYLLTCDHLFEGLVSPTICATLSDGSVVSCAYVGGDDRLDVAVLKMERRQMACLPLDPTVTVATGQRVAAVGCPEDGATSPVVTAGIVSSVSTRVNATGDYPQRCIRTDAPVMPGCSGGALVTDDGLLLGMIQSKDVSSGAEGAAYVIPVQTIADVIDELIQNGCLRQRVKVGMAVSFVSPVVGAATGKCRGLKIERFSANSAPASLGLSVGDVIRAVDGEGVTSLDSFFDRLESAQANDNLLLTVEHSDGSERQVLMPVTFERGTNRGFSG